MRFLMVTVALSLVVGCDGGKTDGATEPAGAKPADTKPADAHAASKPARNPMVPEHIESRPVRDKDYIKDPEAFPKRAGAQRVFLQQDNVNNLRDPAPIPGTHKVVVVAKIGPELGLWRVGIDGEKPAEQVLSLPRFDKSKKVSADNRRDWYLGTPDVFPDGVHVIFEGSSLKRRAKYGNVLGLGDMKKGTVEAVIVDGVKSARNPTVGPDGKTVVVATCNQLRKFTLNKFTGGTVQTTELFGVTPVSEDSRVCAIHRPRFSPDGSFIVFEVVGKYLDAEAQKKFNVPKSNSQNDAQIEPWIIDADGQNPRRLISDAAYDAMSGRLQAGGTKDPAVSPDNQWVVMSHGWSLAMVSKDGQKSEVLTAHHVTSGGVTFQEFDPVFTDDGLFVVAASRILSTEDRPRRAPPGLVVVDLAALKLQRPPPAATPPADGSEGAAPPEGAKTP